MEKKQSEMKTAKQIAKEIFYLPATNNRDIASIELGAKMIEEYASQFKNRESPPVTADMEEAAKKCIDALDTVNQYEAFIYGAQWQLKQVAPVTGTTEEKITMTKGEFEIQIQLAESRARIYTLKQQSTTIERLTKALERARIGYENLVALGALDFKYCEDANRMIDRIDEALASIKSKP